MDRTQWLQELRKGGFLFWFRGTAIERTTGNRRTFDIVGVGRTVDEARKDAKIRARRSYPCLEFRRLTLKERSVE